MAAQAGRPQGLVGRLVGQIMALHNRRDSEWTLRLLAARPDDHVLEVGFGPGVAIESLANSLPTARIAGVDHSETMFRSARRRNQASVDRGRVDLLLASVNELPYDDESFDRVFSIHSIYFWDNPVTGLRELYRVLKPGGRVAITVRDRERKVYRAFRAGNMGALLRAAGFTDVEVESNGVPSHPLLCALGAK